MTFNFKYEDAGEIRTLSVGVKETGIHFNRSEAVIASTYRTELKPVTHGDETYYMLEQINFAYAYMPLFAFSNTAFKNNVSSAIDWTDESCQIVATSGMHNFGRNESGHYYQEITYGDGGSCYLQFFIWTNPETQQSYVANAGFSGFKPHGTNGWIALSQVAMNNLIDDVTYSVRPNIMLLKATMTDDIVSSPYYEQDFDVIIIVRNEYYLGSQRNSIMIADERLFTGARRNDPSKSTAKGNTPNGFRGTRSDASDSDTESHIGSAINSLVNYGNHGVRLYRLGSGNIDIMYECLWSDSFWDKWNNAKWNPLSGILALQAMPCEPDATFTNAQEVFVCGKRLDYHPDASTTVITYGDMPDNSTAEKRTKIFRPKEYSGSFLDWSAFTSVKFRLPFIGIVPVDVSKIMDGGIFAKYNIDFLTGNCLVQIYTIPSIDVMGTETDWDETYGGCLCMIGQYAGNCAHKLTISGTDFGGGQVMGSVVSAVMSVGTAALAAATGVVAPEAAVIAGAMGVIGNTAKASMAQHHNQVIPATPNADTMGMLVPALIIERPIDITPLDENGDATIYEYMNGRPAASGGTVKDYKSLDTGEGIFIKGILHADTLYATEDEKRQIESAFAKGVYL